MTTVIVTSKDGIDLQVRVQVKSRLQEVLTQEALAKVAATLTADELIDDGYSLVTEPVQS